MLADHSPDVSVTKPPVLLGPIHIHDHRGVELITRVELKRRVPPVKNPQKTPQRMEELLQKNFVHVAPWTFILRLPLHAGIRVEERRELDPRITRLPGRYALKRRGPCTKPERLPGRTDPRSASLSRTTIAGLGHNLHHVRLTGDVADHDPADARRKHTVAPLSGSVSTRRWSDRDMV